MKLNEILEPCPFCGSEVELSCLNMERGGVTSIEVRCRCGAEVRFESDDFIYDHKGGAYQMGLTAIEKFNRRVDIPKGSWIKSEEAFICSCCGNGYKDQPTLMGKPMFEYCPFCGAHMKGVYDEAD